MNEFEFFDMEMPEDFLISAIDKEEFKRLQSPDHVRVCPSDNNVQKPKQR